MNIYDIETSGTYSQIHSVVADSMAEAERVFMGKYWPCIIREIKLHSKYVQIQKTDEQPRTAEVKEPANSGETPTANKPQGEICHCGVKIERAELCGFKFCPYCGGKLSAV